MSLLIKGGRVVTAADDYLADVFVEGERITLIGESLDMPADRTIDATRQVPAPGLRRSPHAPGHALRRHCHDRRRPIRPDLGGVRRYDDPRRLLHPEGQDLRRRAALSPAGARRPRSKQLIDMGYRMAVTDLKAPGSSLEELAALPAQGITSYKLFMAYKGALQVDDETLFKTMEVAADTGALVMVHMPRTARRDRRARARRRSRKGRTEPHVARAHPPARARGRGRQTARSSSRASPAARCSSFTSPATRQSSRSRSPARRAARSGARRARNVTLRRTRRSSSAPNFEGAKYVYTPPPRDVANQDVLWDAVRSDELSVISTDHCAFLWEGQKTLGRDDFSKIPNGGPGLENRLQMIQRTFGVREGRIGLNRMVELLATNPAKLFGLYPRKGTLAVGSDADIVIFDPERRVTISASTHHSRIDYSLYEGTEVVGVPELVLLRGNVLVENGELVASPGIGAVTSPARRSSASRARAGDPGRRQLDRRVAAVDALPLGCFGWRLVRRGVDVGRDVLDLSRCEDVLVGGHLSSCFDAAAVGITVAAVCDRLDDRLLGQRRRLGSDRWIRPCRPGTQKLRGRDSRPQV